MRSDDDDGGDDDDDEEDDFDMDDDDYHDDGDDEGADDDGTVPTSPTYSLDVSTAATGLTSDGNAIKECFPFQIIYEPIRWNFRVTWKVVTCCIETDKINRRTEIDQIKKGHFTGTERYVK